MILKKNIKNDERNLNELPDNLPIPLDDGACDHLQNFKSEEQLILKTSTNEYFNIQNDIPLKTILFIFPKAGSPLEPNNSPEAWDLIPGARGCTPQSCGFRDLNTEFLKFGYTVFELSTQTPEVLNEIKIRNHFLFTLLSDSEFKFQKSLNLPTFVFDGSLMIKRMALIIHDKKIVKVFYPVFPPNKNAELVLNWIKNKSNVPHLKLITPDVQHFDSFIDFVNEMKASHENIWDPYIPKENESALEFTQRLKNREHSPEKDLVPETIYWALLNDEIVGRISLRHELRGNLKLFGGHIGYEVRPSYRKMGLATQMLKLILNTEKAKSIQNLLLTCKPENEASNKTILNNNGILKEKIFVDFMNEYRNHYWITLK